MLFTSACRTISRLLDSKRLVKVLNDLTNDRKAAIMEKNDSSVGVGVGFNVDVSSTAKNTMPSLILQ